MVYDNKWGVGLKPCFLSTNFYISVAFKINNNSNITLLATKSIIKLLEMLKFVTQKTWFRDGIGTSVC